MEKVLEYVAITNGVLEDSKITIRLDAVKSSGGITIYRNTVNNPISMPLLHVDNEAEAVGALKMFARIYQ